MAIFIIKMVLKVYFSPHRVQKANAIWHTKFQQNWANGFCDIAVFPIFKMSTVRHLGFWKCWNYIG